MATMSLSLTTTWQLITAEAFIGQLSGSAIAYIRNDTTLPSGDVPSHPINDNQPLAYPAPLAGSWYARVLKGVVVLTFTEVS